MTPFERKRAEIDDLMRDYEQTINTAVAWWVAYKKRNSGFRCKRLAPDTQQLQSDRAESEPIRGGFRCKA